MVFESLCIDLIPDRQIHRQTDTHTDTRTDRQADTRTDTQTDRYTDRQADIKLEIRRHRTYQVLIRIIRENKVLQERGKAKFENENYNTFSS